MSPGRDNSDTDMEPPMQSVGQDCEATPPLLRHHHPGGGSRQPLAQNNYYSSGPGDGQNTRQMQQARQYAPPAVVRHSPHARRSVIFLYLGAIIMHSSYSKIIQRKEKFYNLLLVDILNIHNFVYPDSLHNMIFT